MHFCQRCYMAVVAIVAVFLFYFDAELSEQATPLVVTFKKQLDALITEAAVDDAIIGGDTHHNNWTELVLDHRNQFFEQLKKDYGQDNFVHMFQEDDNATSRGRSLYTSVHGLSWRRLQRKLAIKILQAKTTKQPRHTARLVWATGGHSAAAGHGNLLDEAYTAVMERTMKPLLASLGVEFVARPYAMGGTSSAEELALCVDQIFGEDIDILTWDFGMMEGGGQWKHLFYTYHAALGENHPAAIGIDIANNPHRVEHYAALEELGMTAFFENITVRKQVRDAIPNTHGLTDTEIGRMPPFVKRFKCGDVGVENGMPGCGGAKYTKERCPERYGRASWHPGWKSHALTGNSLSLFLVEVLLDAVQDLDTAVSEGRDLRVLLDQYTAEEEQDYANIVSSPIPENIIRHRGSQLTSSDEEVRIGNFSLLELYKRRAFCHTALLPAQMRYKGLLTKNFNRTGNSTYDKGIPQPQQGDKFERKDGGSMRLAYVPHEHREFEGSCPYNIGIDFKDFFYISSYEGKRSLSIPNDESKAYYNVDTSQMLGMVMMCLTACDWGKCPRGDVKSSMEKDPLRMTINGVSVTKFNKLGECWALKGEEDGYRWKPNSDGKYEIEASVRRQGFFYLRVSSFILI